MARRPLLAATLASAALLATGLSVTSSAQDAARPAAFTEPQADNGRHAYSLYCAPCHGADLTGTGASPPLAGPAFLARWGARTTGELATFTSLTMPPDNAGGLTAGDYANITAHVLATNRAEAGDSPLTAASTIRIESAVPRAAAAVSAAADTALLGVTVAGRVERFAPISRAELASPDPADWPMIRRDYRATSFSPLDRITRANVDELELAWVYSMTDREGRDQPAPIALDGVVYVNNPPNVV